MSPGLIAFFTMCSVLAASYAAFAKSHKPDLMDRILPEDYEPDSFDKYVRPAIANLLPTTPRGLTLWARKSPSIEKTLIRSGNPWNLHPEEYVVLQILSVAAAVVVLSLWSALGMAPIGPMYAILGGVGIGYMVPKTLLDVQWGKRKRELARGLPEALDLIRICLNAGMNLNNALSQIVPLLPEGSTQNELSKVVADIRAGRSMEQAMDAFAIRIPTENVDSFVRTTIIAQAMGTDMVNALSSQADEARAEYERIVEIKAQKLQTTLFLPIIGMFIPSLMIIIFGPSLASLSMSI